MENLEQVFIDEFVEFLNSFQEKHNCLIEAVKLEDDAIEAGIFEKKVVRLS